MLNRMVCLVVCALTTSVGAAVVHVDDDALGGDGTSWAAAFDDLQDALAAVGVGDQIWIAEGTYLPGSLPDRSASFEIPDGVSVYGGFPNGGGDGTFAARDALAFVTLLSGDLDDNDMGAADDASHNQNSRHVVSVSGTGSGTLLDGVTVSGGYANGGVDPDFHGGGMIVVGTPTIANCIFDGNFASSGGGAFYSNSASPSISGCHFENNIAGSRGGAVFAFGSATEPKIELSTFVSNSASAGGAVANTRANASYDRCVFTGNTGSKGGAMNFFEFSQPLVTYCQFMGNQASNGGAVNTFDAGFPTFINSTFLGNAASNQGGAAWGRNRVTFINCLMAGNTAIQGSAVFGNVNSSDNTLANCTIVDNVALSGFAAVHQEETTFFPNGFGRVHNSIVYGNTNGNGTNVQVNNVTRVRVFSTNIEGGYAGLGSDNTDAPPLFENQGAGDYRLTSGSPSIDRGLDANVPPDTFDLDNDLDTAEPVPFDLDGNERIVDVNDDLDLIRTVDQGAYEFEGNAAPTADLLVQQLTDIGADALVRLDGSGSSDPETSTANLIYTWTVDTVVVCSGNQASCGTIDVALPFGSHDFILVVADEGGATDDASMTITIDPAALSVFAVKKAKVEFDKEPAKIKISGEIGLPFGVDFSEVAPLGAIDLDLAGVDLLAGLQDVFPFEVSGGDGHKWKLIENELEPLGLKKLDIDWDGTQFKFKDFDLELKSEIITSSESVIEFKYKIDKIGGPLTLAIGAATIVVDAAGDVTADVPFEVEDAQKEITLTLPFPITDTTTLVFSGAIDESVAAADHLKASVGKYKAEILFDETAFPDGSATAPRSLDWLIFIGGAAYPGLIELDNIALEVKGDDWEAKP